MSSAAGRWGLDPKADANKAENYQARASARPPASGTALRPATGLRSVADLAAAPAAAVSRQSLPAGVSRTSMPDATSRSLTRSLSSIDRRVWRHSGLPEAPRRTVQRSPEDRELRPRTADQAQVSANADWHGRGRAGRRPGCPSTPRGDVFFEIQHGAHRARRISGGERLSELGFVLAYEIGEGRGTGRPAGARVRRAVGRGRCGCDRCVSNAGRGATRQGVGSVEDPVDRQDLAGLRNVADRPAARTVTEPRPMNRCRAGVEVEDARSVRVIPSTNAPSGSCASISARARPRRGSRNGCRACHPRCCRSGE